MYVVIIFFVLKLLLFLLPVHVHCDFVKTSSSACCWSCCCCGRRQSDSRLFHRRIVIVGRRLSQEIAHSHVDIVVQRNKLRNHVIFPLKKLDYIFSE